MILCLYLLVEVWHQELIPARHYLLTEVRLMLFLQLSFEQLRETCNASIYWSLLKHPYLRFLFLCMDSCMRMRVFQDLEGVGLLELWVTVFIFVFRKFFLDHIIIISAAWTTLKTFQTVFRNDLRNLGGQSFHDVFGVRGPELQLGSAIFLVDIDHGRHDAKRISLFTIANLYKEQAVVHQLILSKKPSVSLNHFKDRLLKRVLNWHALWVLTKI